MKAQLAISRDPRLGPRAVPAGASARHGIDPPLPIHNVAVMALEGHRFGQMPVHDPGFFPDARHDEQGQEFSDLDLEEMIERATSGSPDPLPYQAALEGRLGRSLAHVEAYSGPDVVTVLQTLDALAASVGKMILFATSQPDIETVAHEVIHVLQSGGRSASEPSMISPRDAITEREAENLARDMTEMPGGPASAPIGVSEQLPPDQVALQRSGSPAMAGDGNVAVLDRPARPEMDRIEELAPATTPAQGTAAPRGKRSTAPPAGEEAATAGAQLPPAPEPGVTAEGVAAREAALAEAETALAGAGDVPQLMAQFAEAPPTVKAARQGQLAQDAKHIAQQETQQFQDDLPDLHATMSSDAPAVEPIAVRSPDARTVVLEDAAPGPAPEPEIAETPDPGAFTANDNATRVIDQFFASAEPVDRAGQVGESLRDVNTKDPEIPHTPGPPPAVPLEGESDPGRLAAQQGEALTGARGVRDEAQAAVISGPGPERSQPISVAESYSVDALNQPTVEPIVPAEGAREFLSMGLPPEVQTAFDQQQQPAMQASMEGAVSQADQAAAERDQARQTEVESAETQAAELSREADEQQHTDIGAARATIQTERQKTLDAQTTAVQDMETSAAERSETDRESIETRVATDEASIGNRYQAAETEVGAEIKQGERDAETKKQEAARAAEEESWWDRAVNFVRDAFNALVDAINVVFDAVRSAVNTILDAAKDFALSVIDAAASFIKSAIAAFGEFLKAAIDGLLGDIFPGLAAALNNAIDTAVSYAQGLVDDVANGLKAGVSALVDGLKAGLNRILDAFQAGLNLAVALVQAALTGDWSALARKLLEAVLLVIGVDPESFYAFIGRAEETFQIILDDPLGFLGNVAEAFTGGVRLFADNILKHLQAGIIGWLTGTLGSAGITLPERFDLFGVLSLVQQILGLTWDRLRQKAVKLVGEQNVARLEHILSYIQTLVTEGWGGLWERIKGDIATLRDQVLDAIKSFILERIVMAAITKIASMFNPVGAIVQLVLTAWNLYTFLRDQLQRIFAVVQVVVNAIGDIARGVLAPGMAKVEEVLASLLPLALDLLARLLGLGNVGTKVREIIESIQQTIDRAIDGLIERVLAAFRGGGKAAKAGSDERQIQEDASQRGAVDVSPGADPNVKADALSQARQALRTRKVQSVEQLHAVVREVYRENRPKGLKSLAFDITNESTLAGELVASASQPQKESIRWDEIVAPDQNIEEVAFKYQTEETIAAVTVNQQLIGSTETSTNKGHAEQNVLRSHWSTVLERARSSETPATVILAINRSPCNAKCSPLLQASLVDLKATDRALFDRTHFILAPTGVYWPSESLSEQQVKAFKTELGEISKTLGPAGREVVERHLARERFQWTLNLTSAQDFSRLQAAGWDLRQLLAARTQPTTYGRMMIEAIQWVAKNAESSVTG